ncbi:pilus assembly protein [Stenotrophomonas maltophilia]|uniref:Pilus assembly protein n=5 Tax=Bacteria TaxID=2 RepID=A0ABY7Y5B8_9GAMM|nr:MULTISPECIES: PilC/PilY family type IV pilus protein [Stenotrophomonas]ALA81942.1 pilus assembly protein [Stenotrophomonas maltophilia]MBH1476086.1 pilus assembly protein [Stenotrophomonas maltophilia]MBH1501832.1 pilus assembly protein [Stenotrophomonas maltophilia]MBH1785550.1 pilus assembly protein [Stenotrophomonas maltophilia]WDM65153.1 pilus assembly protein [Stenotrophomonas sp. DFS-20110405]
MASRKFRFMAAGGAALALGGGYFIYSLMAAQAQGTLAQAPLNIQVQTPPAFLMALDDSGSMLWETLNNTRDGAYRWDGSSFYNKGIANGFDGSGQRYLYVFPSYGRDSNVAIPPLDNFGFARSPDVNSSYYDPRESYPGWKTGLSAPATSNYLEIKAASAPLDPRPAGAPAKIGGALNLTADSLLTSMQTGGRDSGSWRFRFRSGMKLPVGTRIERGRCSLSGGAVQGEGTFDRVTRETSINSSSCDAAVAFYPATFFLENPATLPADYGYTATPVAIASSPGGRPGTLYKYEIKLANFGNNQAKYDNAMQSFANWFSLYRTRREALIGAATNALYDTTNLRVGWFRINGRRPVTMFDMTTESQRAKLLSEITREMRADDSTPNRSAADYLGQQFQRTDEGAPVLLACQKNAGMLFTDGYINEDGNTTLMKDLVAPYYKGPLVPSLDNGSVPVPAECKGSSPDASLDCNKQLHMNFYGVTLGTQGKEFGVKYLPDPERPWVLSPDPYVTKPNFPTTTQNLKPEAVDELWNAVYDSHGEMVNATRPGDITAAMRRIISNVAQGATPSGSRSLTGARIGVGSLSVEPFYEATNNGTDWYGKLHAFKLKVDATTRAIVSEEAWEAAAQMPAAASRRIRFWRDGALVDFSGGNVSLANLCDKSGVMYPGILICSASELEGLATDSTTAVAYLRGDVSHEKRNGGKLRDRSTVLGDIITSTPALSSPLDDYGFRRLPGSMGTSYADYMVTKRNDHRYMVYAAANDGMLHAFDGGMGADGEMDGEGGKELFAYIPSTSLGHMGNLLLPNDPTNQNVQRFQHRYYVDGPVTVSDTYGSNGWTTSLVGTAGAGGRSVFALDVSDPAQFGGAGSLLWEISDLNAALDEEVRANIGHVLGKPVIVPMKNADGSVGFRAIFGNGYESRSGKAVLFVVDMLASSTPTIRMIEAVESGQNLPAGNNGLGNIVVVDRWGGTSQNDRVRDGLADTVYAADKRGAIWKFDLRDDAAPTAPLFTTDTHVDRSDQRTYRQPITGGMTVTTGASGGVMLIFGTGSFSYYGDENDAAVQALYGINDTEVGQPGTTLTSANLRPFTAQFDNGMRTLSPGTVPAQSRGWTVTLSGKERAVGNPRIVSGVVFMPTYIPSESQGCSVDGANWVFGLQASSGEAAMSQVRFGAPDGASPGAGTAGVPLSTGGNAPVRDVTTSVVPRLAPPDPGKPGSPPPKPPGDACMMQISVAGAEPMYLPYPCGRQSWRQIQ